MCNLLPKINSSHQIKVIRRTGSLIANGVLASGIVLFSTASNSQVLPDLSLNSQVTSPDGLNFLIQAGNQSGRNLFHSFTEFSIPLGGTATFANPVEIETIFSRVTGTKLSNIEGLLAAQGSANLFFLNPNGIVFGPEARLNIGGSFLATSASNIEFSDGIDFGAVPSTSAPLLSLGIPTGLQYGTTAGGIVVLGTEGSNSLVINSSLSNLDRSDSEATLAVGPGKSLTLLGGEVLLQKGNLQANGGLYLGAVGAGEEVALESFRPSYSGVERFQDVTIEQAIVDASSFEAGPMELTGQSIRLLSRGVLLSQNESSNPGGTISLQATEAVELVGPNIGNNIASRISTAPPLGLEGAAAGAISIRASSLIMEDGATIDARPFGIGGTGGDISIETRKTIELSGLTAQALPSIISTEIPEAFPAQAGNIQLKTKRLQLQDGAFIRSSSDGIGDSGTIDIQASESVRIAGESPRTGPSQIFSGTNILGVNAEQIIGNGGSLTIATPRLVVADGTSISSSSRGQGNSGRLSITGAEDILLEGTNSRGTGSLISTSAFARGARGSAGPMVIETERLTLRDGGRIQAASFVAGAGGDITIQATEAVLLEGNNGRGTGSDIVTGITQDGLGNSGRLRIETGDLTIKDGGRLTSLTFGRGDAGDIDIKATGSVLLEGASASERFSQISAAVAIPQAQGQGGTINISASSLALRDRTFIASDTQGQGAAGDVNITTDKSISVEQRSSITSQNNLGRGPAGNVNLRTQDFTLDNRSVVVVDATGEFAAGNLTVDAQTVKISRGSRLAAETEAGDRGNITVNAELLSIDPTSLITTNATGTSTGGDINLTSDLIIVQDQGQILAQAISNQGGNIQITTDGLFREAGSVIDASSELGVDGIVDINRPEVDPSATEETLPSQVINVDQLIARSCLRQNTTTPQGQFLVTGIGGLPRLPGDAVMADFEIYQPGRSGPDSGSNLGQAASSSESQPTAAKLQQASTNSLSEAKTFQQLPDGRIALVDRGC